MPLVEYLEEVDEVHCDLFYKFLLVLILVLLDLYYGEGVSVFLNELEMLQLLVFG